MSLWIYLLIVLFVVIICIVFFAKKIITKIIRNRMEKIMMDSLNADNRNAFAGVDLEKLQNTVDSLLKNEDITKDPNLKNNMQNIVQALSNEFSNNMKEVKSNHIDNLKQHEIHQSEVKLDSMLKDLSKLLADKDSDFSKILDRLKVQDNSTKKIDSEFNNSSK